MKFLFSIVLAVAAMLPPAAFARVSLTDPADPTAHVPAPKYESVFRNYQSWQDSQDSPANAWRSANDNVAHSAAGTTMPMVPGQADSMTMPMSMPAGHDMQHKGE